MNSSIFYKLLTTSFLCIFFQATILGNSHSIFPILKINNNQKPKAHLAPHRAPSTVSRPPCAAPRVPSPVYRVPSLDTLPKPSKYQGYRLYLTQINVLKETNNWVKINFSVINTGNREVDFGQKGREHWVQVLFDDSIRSSKLGGFQDNIRQGLYNANFKLAPGKIATDQELKFPKVLKWSQPKKEETEEEVIVLNKKVINEPVVAAELIENREKCPDLTFSKFKIVEKGKKHVVLEYSVKNVGKGPAVLQKKEKGDDLLIGIRVFLSGAPVVSRASKELGMDFLRVPYYKKELYPDEEITQQTKIQTKGKTSFLKYLVLQIDSYQLMQECDRRNNEGAVELK